MTGEQLFANNPILKLRKEESVGSGCLASRRFDVSASDAGAMGALI
jgi:hypothetical protein